MKPRTFILVFSILFSIACSTLSRGAITPQPSDTPAPAVITQSATTLPPKSIPTSTSGPIASRAASHIAQVWANEGGDKVTRDELRATNDPESMYNSVWDGTTISLFGARNETVAFNLVLEAPASEAAEVTVSLESLSSPDGVQITTRPANGEEVFNYVGRNIELFYVRYLEIRGLSVDLAYESYDERHIPQLCRRPYDPEKGEGRGAATASP